MKSQNCSICQKNIVAHSLIFCASNFCLSFEKKGNLSFKFLLIFGFYKQSPIPFKHDNPTVIVNECKVLVYPKRLSKAHRH